MEQGADGALPTNHPSESDVLRPARSPEAARPVCGCPGALSLVQENQPVACNEFHLDEPERIVVVSGPSQGGKTTSRGRSVNCTSSPA